MLGSASYSIYLTHFPVLGFLAKVHALAFVRSLPIELSFALIVGATVMVGIGFHIWVERPITQSAGSLWKRQRHAPLVQPIPAAGGPS